MNNYELSRDRAQQYFLRYDQDALIRSWNLPQDACWIYVYFLGKPYRICRSSGRVLRLWSEDSAGYEEVLSIFDLLCHEGTEKCLSGNYAPVNSLKGRPRTVAVETDFHSRMAARFDKDAAAFCRACEACGGQPVAMGDIGYRFPVFADLSVILKFYHADEEFPAGMILLWDENMLQYVFYETVFYIAGFLLQSIYKQMQKAEP